MRRKTGTAAMRNLRLGMLFMDTDPIILLN
jgi:hypothetical protein